MRNLCRDSMISKSRNKANDRIREAEAHRYQIGVLNGGKFHKSIDPSAQLLDYPLVSERIEHVACNPVFDSLAHAKLTTIGTENLRRKFLHFRSQTKSIHLFISRDIMSDQCWKIKKTKPAPTVNLFSWIFPFRSWVFRHAQVVIFPGFKRMLVQEQIYRGPAPNQAFVITGRVFDSLVHIELNPRPGKWVRINHPADMVLMDRLCLSSQGWVNGELLMKRQEGCSLC